MVIENFGKNVCFEPKFVLMPRTENEVLQFLDQHRGQHIRVAGRLHSWSEAVVTDEVLLDLRYLNSVEIEQRPNGIWASIGAGCQIKKALADLEHGANATLPAVGLITEQAIAGAISTGTHGSGRQCLSHFIAEIRVAVYDPDSGKAVIRTITEGPQLQAARCSLGCLGVILSVGLWCRPQYRVEEHFRRYTKLDEVLAAETSYPLQQFYLVPWSWTFFVQHRCETDSPRSHLAWLYRVYCFITFDISIHVATIFLSQIVKFRSWTRFFFKYLLACGVIRGLKVVDTSDRMLTMKHDLFRHIEIELFVKRSRLGESLAFCESLLRHCDGAKSAFSEPMNVQLRQHGLVEQIQAVANSFTYAYVVCVRKVLRDDTLMSMASGDDEPYYALSFISFARPTEREPFFAFARCLCNCLVTLYAARPHWGKVCPISSAQAEALYPQLPEFRRVAYDFDKESSFLNPWIHQLLFPKDHASIDIPSR